jgi:hypothetical protein
LDNFANKRGNEILEHLDIIRFTKAKAGKNPGIKSVKKRGM